MFLTSSARDITTFLSKETNESRDNVADDLSHPPQTSQGDYTYACFAVARQRGLNPQQLSQELAEKFKSSDTVEKAVSAGPYLNFFVNKSLYQQEIVETILKQKTAYGHADIGKEKKIVIEYSSPNIAKPFHVGHFRATIIGNALKKIHEALGYHCIGINYVGDWGTQFGKLITAFKKWGEEEKLEIQPIPYLNSLYIRFHEEAKQDPSLEDEARAWFKKCEQNDKEAIRLWKKFKQLSLKEFKKIYAFLGVEFDVFSAESEYNSVIEKTIALLKEKTPAKISEGALIVDLAQDNLPPALILRSDGASLYLTRDIAALLDRYSKYRFDQMIYVVGDTQTLHFKQLFKLIERMKYDWALRCAHVAFGQIRLKDEQISTRHGTAILLEDLLSKAIALIQKIIEKKNPKLKNKRGIAERVGLAALIFADFGSKRIKNVIFDWEIILNPDGDTGPYVMYTFARAASILRKAKKLASFRTRNHAWRSARNLRRDPSLSPQVALAQDDLWRTLESVEEHELIQYLERFPKTVQLAARHFEPSYLASYLLDLSKRFNRFYHEHRVICDDPPLQATRLKLVTATQAVLKSGLHLIGIREVEAL